MRSAIGGCVENSLPIFSPDAERVGDHQVRLIGQLRLGRQRRLLARRR